LRRGKAVAVGASIFAMEREPMSHPEKLSPLALLIQHHKDALARRQPISRETEEAQFNLTGLSPEAANRAERLARAALMAHPVETLNEAREKAAYFQTIDFRAFADDITLAYVHSLVAGVDGRTAFD
jgi:hypothetical protein